MSNKKSNSFENKYTAEDLKIMQSWSLQKKDTSHTNTNNRMVSEK